MRKLVYLTLCVIAAGSAAGPASAKQAASSSDKVATCDAKYFNYLVGRGIDEARSISGVDYRVLANGADGGAANPKRMTIKVDSRNTIVDVSCG